LFSPCIGIFSEGWAQEQPPVVALPKNITDLIWLVTCLKEKYPKKMLDNFLKIDKLGD